jgi:hypothetical protein
MRQACRFLLASLVLLLAACAAPPRVSLAPGALQTSQSITIVVPPEPQALFFYGFHPGMAFGAVGGAIAGAQFAQTGESLSASMRSQGLSPHAALARSVQRELGAAGYTVRTASVPWSDAGPANREPRLQQLGPEHQRVLVLNPRQVGFASFGLTQPYRPVVRMTATLYGTDRARPLYAGAVQTGYNIDQEGWIKVPPGSIDFNLQSDLLAQPARAADAFRDGVARVARATVQDMVGSQPALASPRAPATRDGPAPEAAREYAGSLRCAAYEGAGRVDSPGPWVAPVQVRVSGVQATMHRGDGKYSESLTGRVSGSDLRLEGRGAMNATPMAYWVTRVWGAFSPDGGGFDGKAELADPRGSLLRRCTVDLVRR